MIARGPLFFALLMLSMAALGSPAHANADTALGFWHTPNSGALVEVKRCGASICGTILELTREADGKTILLDKRNEDASLRTRRIKGLMILSGYKQQGDHWVSGTIYAPERGKAYRSKITPLPDGSLKVEGCVAQFCQAQIWRRASSGPPAASQ